MWVFRKKENHELIIYIEIAQTNIKEKIKSFAFYIS